MHNKIHTMNFRRHHLQWIFPLDCCNKGNLLQTEQRISYGKMLYLGDQHPVSKTNIVKSTLDSRNTSRNSKSSINQITDMCINGKRSQCNYYFQKIRFDHIPSS